LELQSADVPLADLTMPEQNGVELAKAIRARWPDTRVLPMTD
jgi:DNA-binding NarL/FixJ family response regulator